MVFDVSIVSIIIGVIKRLKELGIRERKRERENRIEIAMDRLISASYLWCLNYLKLPNYLS